MITESPVPKINLGLDITGGIYILNDANTTNTIRVGDPSLLSDNDHVYLAGEQNAEIVEQIIIIENHLVGCINPIANIKLIIPDEINIVWASTTS